MCGACHNDLVMALPEHIKNICVYTGSSIRVAEHFHQLARDFGAAIAARGRGLVYGGGRVGLMGLCADAALAGGAPVIGIIPSHLQQWEVEHKDLTELLVVDSMHNRKRMMVERADAFVVLPGGFGTLDEAFEIMTWKQVHLHDKPIVILNSHGYWDPLLRLIEHVIQVGFAHETHTNLFKVATNVDEAFDMLSESSPPVIGPRFKWM